MKLIGKIIKWHRNYKGLTQEQLADGICSVTQLSKIENQQIPAQTEILIKIAKKLDLHEHQLINPVNSDLYKQVIEWLNYIHDYDLPRARIYFEKFKQADYKQESYEFEYLYDLTRFGHYLLTDQHKLADALYQKIMTYKEFFKEVDPYSYFKFVGEYLRNKGLYIDSLTHLKEAEINLLDTDDPELYILLANVHSHLENLLVSNDYATRALRIFQEKLYYMRIIECEITLSANHTFIQEYAEAKANLARLESLIDDKFDQVSIVRIYFHNALVRVLNRELDEAEVYVKKCLSLNINEVELIHSRYLIAHLHYLKGNEDLVRKYINTGIKVCEEYNLEYYLIKFKVLELIVERNQEELVDYLRKRAIPFFRLTGQAFDMKYYYQLLGYNLYTLKRYKKAAEILMIADDARNRLLDYNIDRKK